MNKVSLIIIMFLLGFATNYLLVIFFGVETFSSATQGYGVKSYVEMKDKLNKLNEKVDTLLNLLSEGSSNTRTTPEASSEKAKVEKTKSVKSSNTNLSDESNIAEIQQKVDTIEVAPNEVEETLKTSPNIP